nr:hypothetical protein [Tanacetum cinerariifolium]
MWNSIQNGPYVRPMIPDTDGAVNINGTVKQILKPLSKMTEVKEGESLESVYERLTTLVNIMDRNNVRPISVSINTNVITAMKKDTMLMIVRPRVHDAKYSREQVLLALKDEAERNLNNEENDFMLDTSYGEETMEELTVAVMNSNVMRALFTTLVTVKSKNLGATSVVAKSRLSVVTTPKATNKSPKSNTAQSLPSETKSRIRVRSTSNTPITTQKWVAKLSILSSAFVLCDEGTVCFGNDHFAAITGYGDYVQGNLTICHNLKGDDLCTDSHKSNLYTIFTSEMAASSPVCLMFRATSTKSWLWHRRLSHLNFGTLDQLTSKDLVDGLSKFKYNKDHLCLAYEQDKSKKASFLPKLVPSTKSKLKLLQMDWCGPMRVASINGKKFILVTVDDYSQLTWNRSIIHTLYNKTPYELIRGRKPNIQYFHVFGSLCCPTNDRDDLGKMKPKADIDLDNLFGPLYEEYYTTSSQEVSNNFAANTLDNEHTYSSSSIVVEKNETPQIVSSSAEQVTTEPNSQVLNENANEFVQEDLAYFDGNVFYNAPPTLVFEEAESSSTYQDPSNMHEFHQKHRSSNRWTKNHLIEQVIGDPSKPVMTIN